MRRALSQIWHKTCLNWCACLRRDGMICWHQNLFQRYLGEFQECFNSTKRGITMPAFTFEKISPPVRRGPIPPIVKKQRGLIVQMLDSFVAARVKKSERKDNGGIARYEKKPPD